MISAERRRAVGLDDSGVEPSAVLDGSHLSLVIDVHDAKSSGIAVAPLVIVEQRPGEISSQIYTLSYRVVNRSHVRLEILNTKRVLDASIVRGRTIRPGRSVLG